ncbi:thioredoxin family protein [Listeria fleischmannii]|jgi:predicted bacteriocin transport accessory protein|uniref:Thioredoxin family protein n=1 Tax=Listeria fleischmannii TaxID=1069827 RepID=A0A841YDF8_9LIST|nr:thioredoxin family protein [Listeria fleischmannii]EIA21176.1 secreted thioredoxin, putative [Listeria fleischmannii subsp. coloradonensis]MBC1398187.1 thioredoxin family protein [Listeria fleischmannii]MBC1426248.1 thioredoxin family protein [Listeria fleischmannii]STY35515.1 thioredoxin 2 [Listeria fleischmannii subsp. coloradonensis]
MKKIMLFIGVCVLGLALAACSQTESQKKEASEKTKETSQAGKAFLTTIGTKDFKEQLDQKEDGFIYVGRPSCVDCQAFQPILKEALQEEHFSGKMAYYNTDAASKENREQMMSLLKGLKIDSVPTMVYLKDGKVASKFLGNDSKSELKEWLSQNK